MSILANTTVIVPVLNGARTLAACVDSLLALHPQPAEIMVVVNRGPPKTALVSDSPSSCFSEDSRNVLSPVKNPDDPNTSLRRLVEDQEVLEAGDRPQAKPLELAVLERSALAQLWHVKEALECSLRGKQVALRRRRLLASDVFYLLGEVALSGAL